MKHIRVATVTTIMTAHQGRPVYTCVIWRTSRKKPFGVQWIRSRAWKSPYCIGLTSIRGKTRSAGVLETVEMRSVGALELAEARSAGVLVVEGVTLVTSVGGAVEGGGVGVSYKRSKSGGR